MAGILNSKKITLKTLSPVHIGAGAEKNLQRGLDFVVHRGKIVILKSKNILESAKEKGILQNISTQMAQGNKEKLEKIIISSLLSDKSINKVYPLRGKPTAEIKVQITDGFGEPYIPGSSLKGAIRSVLLKDLLKAQKTLRHESVYFGEFSNSFMRFLRIPDIRLYDEDLNIYPAKIYSGDKIDKTTFEGRWKNDRNSKHSSKYETIGFETYYEAFMSGIKEDFILQMGFDKEYGNFLKRNVDLINFDYFNNLSIEKLFEIIKNHTRKYLSKEIEFFEKFKNGDLGNAMVLRLGSFMEINDQPNTCIIRVGAGVGFHSITGDWQDVSESHVKTWVKSNESVLVGNYQIPSQTQKKSRNSNQIFAKTRKIAVENDEQGDPIFMPMGFIQLSY